MSGYTGVPGSTIPGSFVPGDPVLVIPPLFYIPGYITVSAAAAGLDIFLVSGGADVAITAPAGGQLGITVQSGDVGLTLAGPATASVSVS